MTSDNKLPEINLTLDPFAGGAAAQEAPAAPAPSLTLSEAASPAAPAEEAAASASQPTIP